MIYLVWICHVKSQFPLDARLGAEQGSCHLCVEVDGEFGWILVRNLGMEQGSGRRAWSDSQMKNLWPRWLLAAALMRSRWWAKHGGHTDL